MALETEQEETFRSTPMQSPKIGQMYGPALEATASLTFVATVELICSLGADAPGVVYLSRCAAGAFLIAAAIFVILDAAQAKRNNGVQAISSLRENNADAPMQGLSRQARAR